MRSKVPSKRTSSSLRLPRLPGLYQLTKMEVEPPSSSRNVVFQGAFVHSKLVVGHSAIMFFILLISLSLSVSCVSFPFFYQGILDIFGARELPVIFG